MSAPGAEQPIIELRSVSKSFSSPAGTFIALKEIILRVRPGEFVAVIGKSGSGKSTLLNMIAGIDRPTSGQVFVDGVGLHDSTKPGSPVGAAAGWGSSSSSSNSYQL